MFYDAPVAWNYMTKTVVALLKEKFSNVTWKCDERIENGHSRRRLGLLLDMEYHIVIVEVDENSHVGYNPICKEKRLE